jgi:hypothetical protein
MNAGSAPRTAGQLWSVVVVLLAATVAIAAWIALPEAEPSWMARDRSLVGASSAVVSARAHGVHFRQIAASDGTRGMVVASARHWMLRYPVTATYRFEEGVLREICYDAGAHLRPLGDLYYAQLVRRCTRQFGPPRVGRSADAPFFDEVCTWETGSTEIELTHRPRGALDQILWTCRERCTSGPETTHGG